MVGRKPEPEKIDCNKSPTGDWKKDMVALAEKFTYG